ncbi:Isoamyl acetate-hydrolyzing esterase [Phaffia rhodozyma]|uniref:Isoamyl acetate-hydrolyzing esterase n=1 Tax=Phaffia rhodozyma TaxID=264483 RepID=A0A0F7SHL5_PHARH|nr:Isoamyl acetate-hydrolyzing esterase [Phaffia rhodozyma]
MSVSPQNLFVAFGDSLTQTWDEGSLCQRLAYSYCRKLDVINRGYGGYNTEWALPILDQASLDTRTDLILPREEQLTNGSPKIEIMTVWFGANDACLPPSAQHLSISDFSNNLDKIITSVQTRSPQTKLVLITPPPIHGPTRAGLMAPRALDRSQENTKAFADAVLKVGQDTNVPVVDIFRGIENYLGGDLERTKEVLRDGLHFNKEGYQVLYDLLISTIKENYPSLEPDTLQLTWPVWSDIDRSDVQRSVVARPRDEL